MSYNNDRYFAHKSVIRHASMVTSLLYFEWEARIIWRLTHTVCLVLILAAGWELSWGYWLEHLHMAFQCCCLSSSQHGGWVLKSQPFQKSRQKLYNLLKPRLSSQLCLFCHNHRPCQIQLKGHTLYFLREKRHCHCKNSMWDGIYQCSNLWKICSATGHK